MQREADGDEKKVMDAQPSVNPSSTAPPSVDGAHGADPMVAVARDVSRASEASGEKGPDAASATVPQRQLPVIGQQDPAAFPTLNEDEIAAARRCGHVERCRAGLKLWEIGEHPVDFFIVVSGSLEVVDTTGEQERHIESIPPGCFSGDINLFAGRPATLTGRAEGETEVIRLTNAELRHFLVLTASFSDKWISAFLRRTELIEAEGVEGLRVFGPRSDAATLQVSEFLHRNGVLHRWIDTSDHANDQLLSALRPGSSSFPVVARGQEVLAAKPSLRELACRVGVTRPIPPDTFEIVIIGGGPAGLGAAVYAASEGLKTVILDAVGPGGQAGASSRIENFAGFPAGISGRDLALRSYLQALKFGGIFSAPHTVRTIRCLGDGMHQVITDDGTSIRCRTVILAMGVHYRSLQVAGLSQLQGVGVYFSATQVEALLCNDQPVHIIGGGNSAGQAATYLSTFTGQVRLVVRGDNLHKSMSSYLAERVLVNPRVRVLLNTELRGVEGSARLESVHLENTRTGEKTSEPSAGIFVFIGAQPCTEFLDPAVKLDAKGFVVTAADLVHLGAWKEQSRGPLPLETSCPGIFAAGDCRASPTKRVAFAIGDGALAVNSVHELMGTYS